MIGSFTDTYESSHDGCNTEKDNDNTGFSWLQRRDGKQLLKNAEVMMRVEEHRIESRERVIPK